MGGQPRHLYHQVMRRLYQKEEFCSDSGVGYILDTHRICTTLQPQDTTAELFPLCTDFALTDLHPPLQHCAACNPHRPRDAPAARDTPVPPGDLNVLFSPGWDKPAQPVTAPRAVNR